MLTSHNMSFLTGWFKSWGSVRLHFWKKWILVLARIC